MISNHLADFAQLFIAGSEYKGKYWDKNGRKRGPISRPKCNCEEKQAIIQKIYETNRFQKKTFGKHDVMLFVETTLYYIKC